MFSQCRQPSVCSIEEPVLLQVILWVEPLFLELPPDGFGDVQMRRVWWQVSDEQSPFFPKVHSFDNATRLMHAGIVQNQDGFLFYIERKFFQELNDNISIDTTFRHYTHILALPVDESQYVDFIGPIYGNMYLFSGELPAIRHISLGTDMGFISVIEVYFSSLTQLFKLRNHLHLMEIIFRVGLPFGTGSYPFISSVSTFKKRCKVLSLMDLPRLASHSALATCTRWRCDLTASSKLSLSSMLKIGLRPCPGLLRKPEMPSDLKRETQWLTLIWLILVIKPTSLELRPSAFSKITWQRVRKQWLSPCCKPSSKARRSCVDSCGVFTRPMAAKIRNNIK